MARSCVNLRHALGVSIQELRKIAKNIGKDHDLALCLWDTSVHEVRILATMIDDPALVTPEQMDQCAHDCNSWDLCDQCCNNLFARSNTLAPRLLYGPKTRKNL